MCKNMRKRSNILLHGVVHAVDQGKDAHQQEQPLPERKSDLSCTELPTVADYLHLCRYLHFSIFTLQT